MCLCARALVFDRDETCTRCGHTAREVPTASTMGIAVAIARVARGDGLRHDRRTNHRAAAQDKGA